MGTTAGLPDGCVQAGRRAASTSRRGTERRLRRASVSAGGLNAPGFFTGIKEKRVKLVLRLVPGGGGGREGKTDDPLSLLAITRVVQCLGHASAA